MDLEEKLAQVGLSGTLFKLYKAAVELGEAPVSDIASRAGLARTTAYDGLARLADEGLIAFRDRTGRKFAVAREPGILLERVEARRQMLDGLMPHLRAMYNDANGRASVRLHPGRDGIREALWDTLNGEATLLRATFAMSELIELPGLPEIDAYFAERRARGIWMRVIRSAGRDVMPIWPSSQEDLRELRFAPEACQLGMTTFIYGNKVCLVSSQRESYGLIIDSAEFADFQTAMFDAVWNISTVPSGGYRPEA